MLTDPVQTINHYFVPALEQETELHAIIDILVELREYMLSQGCHFPLLTDVLKAYRVELRSKGIKLDDSVFEALYEEFAKREFCSCSLLVQEIKHKSKHKKDKKEVKVNSKTAVGFLKFCAGSLLCLVPVPIIQGAGATLAVIGLNDMINSERTEADNRDSEKRFEDNRRVDAQLDHP